MNELMNMTNCPWLMSNILDASTKRTVGKEFVVLNHKSLKVSTKRYRDNGYIFMIIIDWFLWYWRKRVVRDIS